MKTPVRNLFTAMIISCLVLPASAQENAAQPKEKSVQSKNSKPYKIQTSGKRITIQSSSSNTIKRILVWTSTGRRIVEQQELDIPVYAFTLPGTDKFFFLLLEMKDGKRYTDKFGVQ